MAKLPNEGSSSRDTGGIHQLSDTGRKNRDVQPHGKKRKGKFEVLWPKSIQEVVQLTSKSLLAPLIALGAGLIQSPPETY